MRSTDVGLGTPLPLMQVVLPIGISFFTFQAISYVVDVYRRDTPAASLGDVAILQAFFPHLVAGPIVRANELLPQLRTPRDPRAVLAGPALLLIAGGFVKKTVVADELARRIVDPVFNDPLGRSGPEVVLAIYGFAGQIYCDFSGYTDMAIGLALLLGFKLPQNFDRPYTATSLRQFWRRWHMTLSRWLRDYLYIPLGGSRDGPAAHVPEPDGHDAARRPLARRGLDLRDLGGDPRHRALDRAGAAARDSARQRLPPFVGWFVTFNVVCLAWVFFRAPDLATAFDVLGQIGAGGPSPLVTLPVVALAIAAVAVQAVPRELVARGRGMARGPARARPGRSCSGSSSSPRMRPWESRAWPRSSTTGSDMWLREDKALSMPAGQGARGAGGGARRGQRSSTPRRSSAPARACRTGRRATWC